MVTQKHGEPNHVVFIGPLPPPVTGMTAMTSAVVQALQEQGPVTCFNWSRNKPLKGVRWKLARVWGVSKSICGLLWRGRRPGDVLYYPANSGWGMVYDMVFVSLARLLGYRTVLHHHVYSYLDQYDRRMALVNRLLGSRGAHAVHCEKMKQDFLNQYQTDAQFLKVLPTIVSLSLSSEEREARENIASVRSPRPTFTIGFLSNLSMQKGIQDVLRTFEILEGCSAIDVRLLLAGPCMNAAIGRMVDDAEKRWPEQVEFRGPVYGEEKSQFFSEVDVLLLPTQTESWGIVLTEAMATGCPVIANDRGCVSYIIRDGCGMLVAFEEDFVSLAVGQIKEWIGDSDLYRLACRQALLRSQDLESEAEEQLPAFVENIRFLS